MTPTGVQVVVSPVDPPIFIPPQGGAVRFLVEIVNRSNVAVDVDFWTELEAPGGGLRASRPRSLTVGAGATLMLRTRQRIPAQARPGTYSLRGFVGTFPAVDDSDAFTFVKRRG
jgi:hypothetical protein